MVHSQIHCSIYGYTSAGQCQEELSLVHNMRSLETDQPYICIEVFLAYKLEQIFYDYAEFEYIKTLKVFIQLNV